MSKGDAAKPILTPVKVPWMVAPSTPFLHVHVSEDPNEEPSEVRFVGYLGPLAQNGRSYQIIRVILEPGVWLHIRPGRLDVDPIDKSRFDTQRLPQKTSDAEAFVRRRREEWQRTGLCPDPRMYEVERSPWIEEAGKDAGEYTHLIVSGHDYYVDVLTRGWRYEPAGYLAGEAWQ
jgi:hypothetical protein